MIDIANEQNIEVLRALSKDLCHNLKVARIRFWALFVLLILFIAGTLFALQTGEDIVCKADFNRYLWDKMINECRDNGYRIYRCEMTKEEIDIGDTELVLKNINIDPNVNATQKWENRNIIDSNTRVCELYLTEEGFIYK